MAFVLEHVDSMFEPPTVARLRQSMFDTYFRLRIGLVVLSAVFPLIFWLYWRFGSPPAGLTLDSISAFYGVDGAVRDVFVGILWAVGSFLVGYKGLRVVEDLLLNAAGACAVLIAMFPCDCWHGNAVAHDKVHFAAAVSFFVFMAIVVLFFSQQTVNLLKGKRKTFFKWAYYANAAALIGSISVVVFLHLRLQNYPAWIFRVEWLGIWSFGAFWALKTWEYSISGFERMVARGEVQYRAKEGFVSTTPQGVGG